MLDAETRRRIDTARDILVGKVPDPKSQVEQITIALIYKFMDDMDAESEELGGVRKFFAGDFARYGWPKLVHAGLGGHETLNLYAEAIAKMPENPGIPLLFRDIFKNAYLPYRDPETLRAFLKVIDEFAYDHSERLGDAFEYLLSVLGSQGDAGQFRTPRHIIGFMVEIVDPKKSETVLDPACGTAGFLISSYKHIMRANTDAQGHSTLTPAERRRLADAFTGYDISPDMVRLSLVNMYLHGFADPHIHEYDTLTSLERWNEYADVILANPPFMSPKGGIRPHNRFSVQSKRSEVLFVDYMAEHLTPDGRAGIIVPEGIIFQSQTAYKALRKMLVETSLVAVVSLPSGVFQPYSGVKTSILILDRELARQSDAVAFFKVEADGFDLGAQRRPIERNDLPQVAAEIAEFLRRLRAREPLDGFASASGLIVPKARLAANGECNLSGERYRENGAAQTTFPLASIAEIATELRAGFASGESGVGVQGVPHIRPMNITVEGQFTLAGVKYITEVEFKGREDYALEPGDVLFNNTNSKELVGKTCFITQPIRGGFSNHITRIRTEPDHCVPRFLALLLHNAWRRGQFLDRANRWIGQAGVNTKSLAEFRIPLPPLSVQQEIVAEIEGYQRVIDGARAVVDAYRPHIAIDPAWPMVELGEVCETITDGTHYSPQNSDTGDRLYLTSRNVRENHLDLTNVSYISEEDHRVIYARCPVRQGDVLYVKDGANTGLAAINTLTEEFSLLSSVAVMRGRLGVLDNRYLAYFLNSEQGRQRMLSMISGVAITRLTLTKLSSATVPLPPLPTQRAIVAEIEAEQRLVDGNRELITRMEKKIQVVLDRVWGEGD